jgi:hypothetical protein
VIPISYSARAFISGGPFFSRNPSPQSLDLLPALASALDLVLDRADHEISQLFITAKHRQSARSQGGGQPDEARAGLAETRAAAGMGHWKGSKFREFAEFACAGPWYSSPAQVASDSRPVPARLPKIVPTSGQVPQWFSEVRTGSPGRLGALPGGEFFSNNLVFSRIRVSDAPPAAGGRPLWNFLLPPPGPR